MNTTQKILISVACIALAGVGVYSIAQHRTDSPHSVSTDPYVHSYANADQSAAVHSEALSPSTPKTSAAPVGQHSVPGVPLVAMTNSDAHACTASDLEGSSSVDNSGSSVVGTLVFKARSSVTSCSLSGFPNVILTDKKGSLGAAESTSGASHTVTLKAGETASLRTVWSNWCARAVSADLGYRVTLAGDSGYLSIPALLLNGSPSTDTPVCAAAQTTSSLAVESYGK